MGSEGAVSQVNFEICEKIMQVASSFDYLGRYFSKNGGSHDVKKRNGDGLKNL